MAKKASKSNKKRPAAPPKSAASVQQQDDENNASTMSFLAPDVPLDPQQVTLEGFFPPTIFSDMAYWNGIRVFPKEISTDNNSGALMHTISLKDDDPPYMFTPRGYKNDSTSIDPPTLPVLTAPEAEMWSHKWAAKSAAMQTFPVTSFRLLGTITRNVHVANDARRGPFTNLMKSMKELPSGLQNDGKPQKMTKSNAKVEARIMMQASQGLDVTDTTEQLEAKTEEIYQAWLARFYQGTLRKGWDTNGELCREHVNDEDYVPIHSLRRWLVNYGVVDAPGGQTTTKVLYDGRRSVQLDILAVVNSILELSSPAGLYSTPLILPYAVVTIEDEQTNNSRPSTRQKGKTSKPPSKKAPKIETFERTWKIRIGVYMNRLLPEVLTCRDLLVIMSALDEGSFHVSEPLHLPPTPSRPTFQSCPFPTVVFDDAELHATNHADDSDDEEKKCDEDVVDLTIGDSTREESTISAFSITGLLKLLESTGNDMSNVSADCLA
jgi:hypothetical protein